MSAENFRIGHGYDVHRFSDEFNPAKPLMLAGAKIPEPLSLEAHSDGDLVIHAICDAILGAIAAGDIGQHFPDDDAAFAGIASSELLARVIDLMEQRDFHMINMDVTIVAQLPKLSPHMAVMKSSLSALLDLPADRLNLKATTTEKMGYIGEGLGMDCHAVVLICKNV